jgi:hypothetical protein
VNGLNGNPSRAVLVVGFGGLERRLVDGAWVDDFASPATPGAARRAIPARDGAGAGPPLPL